MDYTWNKPKKSQENIDQKDVVDQANFKPYTKGRQNNGKDEFENIWKG